MLCFQILGGTFAKEHFPVTASVHTSLNVASKKAKVIFHSNFQCKRMLCKLVMNECFLRCQVATN